MCCALRPDGTVAAVTVAGTISRVIGVRSHPSSTTGAIMERFYRRQPARKDLTVAIGMTSVHNLVCSHPVVGPSDGSLTRTG